MNYVIRMHQVAVLARDHDGAERTIRRVLEERLGGAAAVLAAYRDAGGPDYGATAPSGPAAERWRNAVEQALEEAHLAFPALVLRLTDEELAEVLSEEWVTVQPAGGARSFEGPSSVAPL